MRTFYILGGVIFVAVVLGIGLFFFGPASLRTDLNSSLEANASSAVPFTVLSEGTNAFSITDRTNYRIQTADELSALWPMIYGNRGGTPIPTVDFSKYEVLAIFDGSHSTGGYDIAVQSVTDTNAVRNVTIVHSAPATTCQSSANTSSPFEIIQVPITSFSLAHHDLVSTTTCQ